tara:strand:- start:1533 stop:2051 length:519 start_codon:yes stop_codon:yes gene_type:complete
MACDITTGFQVGCNDSAGGVSEFWFANMVDDFAVAYDVSGAASGVTGTGLIYYKYECTNAQGAASLMNDNPTINAQNGTSYFDQTATYVINKMDTAKRNEVKMLARAKLSVIILDNNGKYWLMGATSGVRMTAGDTGTGTALGDRNGYSLSFQAMEFDPMPEVTSSAAFPIV